MRPKTSDRSNSTGSPLGFEADHVDCLVALPDQLFYSTRIQHERLAQLNLESQWPSRN